MRWSNFQEHDNLFYNPELAHRPPLLSQPSRLNSTFDRLTFDEISLNFTDFFVSEKDLISQQIVTRPRLPPVVKTPFKPKKRMTDQHDTSRSGSRGRRSTKNETRWTTPGGSRKNRTIFTDEQHYALVAAYEADKYPTTIQKELLARQLGLAPIVVINWFQHRRQREPVKEKGGFVRNSPGNSRQGTPSYTPASNMDVDGLESGSVPSINEYFASGSKPSNLDMAIAETKRNVSSPAEGGSSSIPGPPPMSTQISDPPSQSDTPVTPTSANGQKSAPYYGRMQTVRAPLPGETRTISNGNAYPKTINGHVGTIRWELDPLYIAPYIDHGFKDAMIPKDPNAFALRPSPAATAAAVVASLRK